MVCGNPLEQAWHQFLPSLELEDFLVLIRTSYASMSAPDTAEARHYMSHTLKGTGATRLIVFGFNSSEFEPKNL